MSTSGIQHSPPDFTPRQRIRGFIILTIVCALSAYLSIHLVYFAWTHAEMPLALRAAVITISVLLLAGVAYLAGVVVARRIRTGRFFITRAEVLVKNAQMRDRLGAGKPFWPQARIWLVGWIFLAILASFGIGTLIAASRLCHCSLKDTALLAALGLACLALPAWYAFKSIRRKVTTGSFLPSQQDWDKAHAQCGRPQPPRQRILLAGLYWIVALLWTGTALSHHTSRHSPLGPVWVVPALWWFAAAVWTWRVFRPRSSQCAIDPGMPPSIKPPAS
jgi:hypothetical protein